MRFAVFFSFVILGAGQSFAAPRPVLENTLEANFGYASNPAGAPFAPYGDPQGSAFLQAGGDTRLTFGEPEVQTFAVRGSADLQSYLAAAGGTTGNLYVTPEFRVWGQSPRTSTRVAAGLGTSFNLKSGLGGISPYWSQLLRVYSTLPLSQPETLAGSFRLKRYDYVASLREDWSYHLSAHYYHRISPDWEWGGEAGLEGLSSNIPSYSYFGPVLGGSVTYFPEGDWSAYGSTQISFRNYSAYQELEVLWQTSAELTRYLLGAWSLVGELQYTVNFAPNIYNGYQDLSLNFGAQVSF